jgi:hypothetical protein
MIRKLARGLAALVLLAILAFCVFGFLASYEPPFAESWGIRLIYGLIGAVCLSLLIVLLLPRRSISAPGPGSGPTPAA